MVVRARFRFRLEAEVRRLEESIAALERGGLDRSLGDSLSESAVYDNHPADIATETFEREKDFGLREDRLATRELVCNALTRLEGENFGVCPRCGKAIPEARLEVIPWAEFCVGCEAAVEEERVRGLGGLSPGRGGGGQAPRGEDDAWQAVAGYGTSSTVAGNPPGAFDESSAGDSDSEGIVDRMDAFPDPRPSAEPDPGGRNDRRPARKSRS